MKYVLAIDSFKGCLSSADVEKTVGDVLEANGEDVEAIPISDGGEGMLEAFTTALNGRFEEVLVHDPLMRPVEAQYGITSDGVAIIETSKACGLMLMDEDERNPLVATTYGVGELVAHAVKNGMRRFVVGLGGSGTSDSGMGMLKALTDAFAKGGTMDDVLATELGQCSFLLASDVRNPLYGPNGAAEVFGRQKGATARMVVTLDNRARRFAEYSARHFGIDKSNECGAGAAGGLGYAFMQYLGAEMQLGADLLLDLVGFDRIIAEADIVITGEGCADGQTLMGKLPERVLQRANPYNVPVWLIAGLVMERERLLRAGFARVESITPDGMDVSEAVKPEVTMSNLRNCVKLQLK